MAPVGSSMAEQPYLACALINLSLCAVHVTLCADTVHTKLWIKEEECVSVCVMLSLSGTNLVSPHVSLIFKNIYLKSLCSKYIEYIIKVVIRSFIIHDILMVTDQLY